MPITQKDIDFAYEIAGASKEEVYYGEKYNWLDLWLRFWSYLSVTSLSCDGYVTSNCT